MAKNAGCASYVEYSFKEKQRFDYTPKDCETFWGAVAKHVVPLMRRDFSEDEIRAILIDNPRRLLTFA